jgi:TP901 family phage tail tape measure protein
MAIGGGTLGTIRGVIKIDYDGAGIARANKDLDTVGKKGKSSGEAMNKAGTLMLGAGVAIAAGFAVAVNSAANFEKGLSNIKAVSGATAAQMEQIRSKALQLGADTKFSAGEAAQAMEELAKAGVSTTDILNGAADATVNLAAAGDIALPEAATIASNAMNQFALAAKDLPKVADLIAGAANASAIDVSQFGFSLSQVGAVAHLAGLSFKDTAVAIAELGNAGIVGSDAGTSLKTFLNNLIPTTKNQIALSKELGLMTKNGTNAFFDQQGHVKSLADISQVLQNATKNLTKEQKLAAFQTLFGSDAIRAAAVLSDQGAAGFNKMATAMDKVKAADVAKTKMDNFKGSLEQMKGSLETLAITLGTILLPPLRKIVDSVTKAINTFQSWSPATQKTIVTVLGIAAAVLIFVGVVFKIIQVIKVFQVVWTTLNISFLASPVGLVILAIIALVAIIVLLATKTRFFQTVWNAIWSFFKVIGAWFAGPFANFFVALWQKVVSVFTAIADFFKFIWNLIVGFFTFYFNIIKGIFNFFLPLFQAVFGAIASIVKLAFAIIGAIIAVAVAIWNATVGPALRVLGAVFSAVVGFIVGLWDAGWNRMANLIRAVWGFIGPYITIAIKTIQIIIGQVISVVTGIWNAGWNRFSSIVSTVWGGIKSFFVGTWNFIVGIFTSARDRIIGIINGVKAVVDRIRQFFNQLKDAASGGVSGLISFVSQIPRRIISALGNLGSSLVSKGRDLIQGFINGIRGMAGRIRDALVGLLPGPLKKFAGMLGLASPSRLFRQWGIFTVQGFVNGLRAMQGTLNNAMRAVANVAASPVTVNGTVDVRSAAGLSGGSTGPRGGPPTTPAITVPPPVVIADLGHGVRQVVKTTIADETDLVAASAAKGADYRGFLSPGRQS